ncbi:multidrug resistance protein, MATE family [Oryzisolibacter propanilivorax]|uniref:Multidrug resistance protein, MATE family n=1 Tax=Oryzisolibacter propanilivorax TaxID=1527607 RepID=A0A1G9P3I2_9BURK|nr:MATE family efflux transporter [Oryzisolibacter propanilivorax]SDL93356.1 multidrug resistance protein, MATE family [Oryzisolibacter propanilivorax]
MRELSTVLRHALTVLAGQLAVMAFGITDTIVAGRHSQDSLAALSIGSAVFISVYVALMGVLQALLPVWSEQRGAGRDADIGASVRQALYLWLVACVLGMAVLLLPGTILRATEVPPALRGEVRAYLAILAFGLPPAMLFRLYSTLNQALGWPQLVTWLQVGALGIKIPLSIWFTFGGAGLPAQGVAGCAWATLVVNYALAGFGLVMLRRPALYAPLRLWQRLEAPDRAQLARFLRLGLPAGLAILVEVTSFTLMALFIARQGSLASAAHQIASNLAAVLYMVPLSLAIATSARVSFWRGSGDERRAVVVAWQGFGLAALAGCGLAATLFVTREQIAGLYTDSAEVVALASALLVWVAAYHVADALQTLCIFVLRSWHVTLAPLLVYGVLLWGVGLAGGHALAYRGLAGIAPLQSPAAFWGASAAALALVALLFTALLALVMRLRLRQA